MHDPNEWEPWVEGGQRHYPSTEEAEYTASLCFLIAVTVSRWAIRKGFAKMPIPRTPQTMPHGERISWLQIDPRAMREWAMLPTAVQLGIGISLPDGTQLQARKTTEELNLVASRRHPAVLPPDHVYVGQGWHKHRLATTQWASHFHVGLHGTAEECMVLYADHLRRTGLVDQIHTLKGKTIVCDNPANEASSADVLIAELAAQEFEKAHCPQEAAVTRWGGQPHRKWPVVIRNLLLFILIRERHNAQLSSKSVG